jgi:copper chaperone CopZ
MGKDGLMKTFVVTGMTCANCVRHVTQAVTNVGGVESVIVDLEAGTAIVQGDPEACVVISAIVEAGYQASV